jgi:hypothetical protein
MQIQANEKLERVSSSSGPVRDAPAGPLLDSILRRPKK